MNWNSIAARVDAALGIASHRDRITSVEGARGVAMSFVFLIHVLEYFCRIAPAGSFNSEAIWFIYPIGNLSGVFFVVLTGCFLYQSLLKAPVNYFDFLRRRLTRIYSVFLVVLAAYVVLSVVFPAHSKLPTGAWAASIFILRNMFLFPGVFPSGPIIGVSWTLSYVVLCCVVLPPLVGLTGMRAWRPRQRVISFLALTILAALVANATGWFPIRLSLLAVGCLSWEAIAWRKTNPQKARWLESAALGISALTLVLKYVFVQLDGVSIFACSQGLRQSTDSAVFLFCLCFALFSANSVCAAALSLPPLRWLGTISFSYYLTHSLFIKALTPFTPAIAVAVTSAAGFWTTVLAAYALSVIPAVVLFLLIEKPSLTIATAIKPVKEKVQAAYAEAA